MKTFTAKASDKTNQWYIVDATDKVLGRLATQVAMVLMGKHRPQYTPNIDLGDHVVIINADKIKINGANKFRQKKYQTFSGYRNGLKEVTLEKMIEKNPEKVVSEAVRRMLPKNILGRNMIKKLKVYTGQEHSHAAQQPVPLEV